MKHTIAKDLERYIEGLVIPQGVSWASRSACLLGKSDSCGARSASRTTRVDRQSGSGKSTFIAAIAAACVDGPLVEPNAESLIIASSFDQGLWFGVMYCGCWGR